MASEILLSHKYLEEKLYTVPKKKVIWGKNEKDSHGFSLQKCLCLSENINMYLKIEYPDMISNCNRKSYTEPPK